MNSGMTNAERRADIKVILDLAKTQPDPIRKDSNEYKQFFEAMAKVWQVRDRFNLPVQCTNFLMFGPQSAGKTTLTERILGFPVGRVKSGIGTTRPMVLTTLWNETEKYQVKGPSDTDYTTIEKHRIMDWVNQQMIATGSNGSRPIISKERIYILVSGPHYTNRRFVDLPGFQSNDEGNGGTREAILDLLRSEMELPNTVVLCVEDSWVDFASSNLVQALEKVFGENFSKLPNLRSRFVLCLNKSDAWFSQSVDADRFVEKVSAYSKGCGLVPILVGGSINAEDKDQGTTERNDPSSSFRKREEGYRGADERESTMHQQDFARMKLDSDLEECLAKKFRGFNCLLSTVDAMVVGYDKKNLVHYVEQLRQMLNQANSSVTQLVEKSSILVDEKKLKAEASHTIKLLLKYLQEIATADSGGASSIISASVSDIKKYGNDAPTEEIKFAFGVLDAKQLSNHRKDVFHGYYKPDRDYVLSDDSTVTDSTQGDRDRWITMIRETIEQLQKKNVRRSISYVDHPLVGGIVYERAFAVWSSTVYRLVAPSLGDLFRLPNVIGADPEMQDPNRFDFKKAKRLAEIYIHRLTPAVHYLCQKMEFLLLHIFDTAFRGIMRTRKIKVFIESVGESKFKVEARACFEAAVKKKAAVAFDKCFSDLHNEVSKLLPYTDDRPSVSGLLDAFPDIADDMRKSKSFFHSKMSSSVKEIVATIFPEGVSNALLSGITYGVQAISVAGSIDPLLFMGLVAVKVAVQACQHALKKNKQNRIGDEVLSEDRDERLLGVTACLYAHFLPRFIMTIDARMRSELWSFVKDPRLSEELDAWLVESEIMKDTKKKAATVEKEIRHLKNQSVALDEAYRAAMAANDIEIDGIDVEEKIQVEAYNDDNHNMNGNGHSGPYMDENPVPNVNIATNGTASTDSSLQRGRVSNGHSPVPSARFGSPIRPSNEGVDLQNRLKALTGQS